MFTRCWHGNLLHFSPQLDSKVAQLSSRYYNQDLHLWQLHTGSHQCFVVTTMSFYTLHRVTSVWASNWAYHAVAVQWHGLGFVLAWATSILGAVHFGRWVVTHSLADFSFHDHRPAICSEPHPLWYLGKPVICRLCHAIGSSRIASTAYQ